jgi:hypothetical protein
MLGGAFCAVFIVTAEKEPSPQIVTSVLRYLFRYDSSYLENTLSNPKIPR